MCLMNDQKTRQTPWDLLDVPIEPLGPPRPPWTPKHRSLALIELLRSPQLPYKSSEDSSNVAADIMGHLTPPP